MEPAVYLKSPSSQRKFCSLDGMNRIVILFGVVLFTALSACKDDASTCEAVYNANCACFAIYEPVCGCDCVTYGNECEAACNNINEFTPGECP